MTIRVIFFFPLLLYVWLAVLPGEIDVFVLSPHSITTVVLLNLKLIGNAHKQNVCLV